MSSWYRAEITVYLDADPKTFDYVLYEQLTLFPELLIQSVGILYIGNLELCDAVTALAVILLGEHGGLVA